MFGPAVAETLGYETGGSMTYANVVDRRIRSVDVQPEQVVAPRGAIDPRCCRRRSTREVQPGCAVAVDDAGPLRAHRSALENRWRTVNEIRDIEELPPVAWGDLPNEKPTTGSPNPW